MKFFFVLRYYDHFKKEPSYSRDKYKEAKAFIEKFKLKKDERKATNRVVEVYSQAHFLRMVGNNIFRKKNCFLKQKGT